jgi:hypothetical protein
MKTYRICNRKMAESVGMQGRVSCCPLHTIHGHCLRVNWIRLTVGMAGIFEMLV